MHRESTNGLLDTRSDQRGGRMAKEHVCVGETGKLGMDYSLRGMDLRNE